MKSIYIMVGLLAMAVLQSFGQAKVESDVLETSSGKLTMYFMGHGTLRFEFNGKIIDIDPVSQYGNYGALSKADLILITHQHGDHLNAKTIDTLTKKETTLIVTSTIADILKKGTILNNGDTTTVLGIRIEAVPAYNTTAGREKMHPKGVGNGYVLTFGNKRVYVAGDTENVPEMASLKNIDVAFLPMNQPYTMVPEQVAEAARSFNPKILYPYHYGNTDVTQLTTLLASVKTIELRIRSLK
jgi:L-ascorbate metabolism protein UlaG (beta-lactamase superfamily)